MEKLLKDDVLHCGYQSAIKISRKLSAHGSGNGNNGLLPRDNEVDSDNRLLVSVSIYTISTDLQFNLIITALLLAITVKLFDI